MWSENPELFLNNEALLPLAPLAATSQPQSLLQQVAERVEGIEAQKRPEILTYTKILAGLKYRKDLIQQLFKGGMMRESVIYQDILAEGRREGRQEGRQEGERSLIIRLLTLKLGELSQDVLEQIETLSLEQLENLGEALLDFTSMNDLQAWLETIES
jgi:predicted transposase YdaD